MSRYFKYSLGANMFQFSKIHKDGDVKDVFILEYIRDTSTSSNKKLRYTMEGDEKYIWVDYDTILESMPYLKISSKSSLSKRICNMETLGLVKSITVGRLKYMKTTELVDSLYYDVTDTEKTEYFESTVRLNERLNPDRSPKRTMTVRLNEPTNQLDYNQLNYKQLQDARNPDKLSVGCSGVAEKTGLLTQEKGEGREGKQEGKDVEERTFVATPNNLPVANSRIDCPTPNATKLQQGNKTAYLQAVEAKFDEFWAIYPKARRVKKPKTLENFIKAVGKDIAKADEIIDSLKKQVEVDKKCLDNNLQNLDTQFYKKIFIISFKESYSYLKDSVYEVDWEEKLREFNRDNKNFIDLFEVKHLTKDNYFEDYNEVMPDYGEMQLNPAFAMLVQESTNRKR